MGKPPWLRTLLDLTFYRGSSNAAPRIVTGSSVPQGAGDLCFGIKAENGKAEKLKVGGCWKDFECLILDGRGRRGVSVGGALPPGAQPKRWERGVRGEPEGLSLGGVSRSFGRFPRRWNPSAFFSLIYRSTERPKHWLASLCERRCRWEEFTAKQRSPRGAKPGRWV